jgi:hypothetical protein
MRSPVSLARLVSVCLAVALTACGSTNGRPIPGPTPSVGPVAVVLSSDLAVGQNRFLFTLVDARSQRNVAVPETRVSVEFFDLSTSHSSPAASGEGVFAWADPGREGVFAVPVVLGAAGAWEARVQPEGEPASRVGFEVRDEPSTPRIGSKAPASRTRTLAGVGGRVGELTSDPRPNRRFYQRSIAQAIGLAIPFVAVFGSPGHCSGTGCAHMLTVAKRVAATTSELTFIHVEVYRDPQAPTPQAVHPAVGEWGLPSEPWLFVVSARGRVVAKFERVVSQEELAAVVASLY